MTLRQIHISDALAGSEADRTPTARRVAAALRALRDELGLDRTFSNEESAEALDAGRRGPQRLEGRARRDARDLPLVTLDPAGSRDLDQAVGIRRRGHTHGQRHGFEIHYAIADVAAFVRPGGPLDRGARERGLTLYCPDRRLPLYPALLSEGAASLLPGVDRAALLWTFEVEADGECRLTRLERAWVRSRRALSYAEAQASADRPATAGNAGDEFVRSLGELGRARLSAELRRGGVSLPIASQSASIRGDHVELEYECSLPVETWNAQVSLLTGMQAARMMQGAGRGLLRTLPPADPETLVELRLAARALSIDWPAERDYPAFVRSLDPALPAHAAMLAQCARALRGAGYLALGPDVPIDAHARHSALASVYAHVTAPLRRLADRYANEVALALFEGRDAPGWALEAIDAMPEAMGAAARRAGELERAAVDLVEAAVLEPQIGARFDALVVRSRPRRSLVQLRDPAVRAPVERELTLGDEICVRLVEADPEKRRVRFEPVDDSHAGTRASGSEPVDARARDRASGSEPVDARARDRASGSEPVDARTGTRTRAGADSSAGATPRRSRRRKAT